MTGTIWRFRLDGDPFDVSGLIGLFKDRVKIEKDDAGGYYLELTLPLDPSDGRGALEAAVRRLAELNSIANVFHGNHRPVTIGGVARRESSGRPNTQFIIGHVGMESRCRFGISGTVNRVGDDDPSVTAPFGDRVLAQAEKDTSLQRALHLYGTVNLDWRGLYMVLEAIEDGNGGETALIKKAWAANGAIKSFKATANSYKALGPEARHGTVSQGVDAPKLTLKESRDMIRQLLISWIGQLENPGMVQHANL